ncbi:MAG: protein kinase domain-containing protein [Nannocystales bacterium]
MTVTVDDNDSGTLAGEFRAAGREARALDASRMFESLSAKLFDGGRTVSIGRFELRERLGAGGMGVVMSAFDPQLHRTVAVKVLRDAGDSEEQARLLDEARAMAKVRHPNLVTVYEAGTHEDSVYIVMEFVEGGTLRAWLEGSPRTWRDVAQVFLQAGRGLAAIHDAGMVHRDFKPDNVLLGEDGRPQVSDFGLARHQRAPMASVDLEASEDGDANATQTGGLAGTPNYLAPEQWRGERADATSDQWSFCVTLHEALFGQRPFECTTVAELCLAVMSGKRTALPESVPAVPRWLERILERGLSTERSARFRTMHELAAAIENGLDTRRGRTLRVAALATLGTGAVAGVAFVATQDTPCQDIDLRLEEAWTPSRKASIAAQFTAVPEFGEAVWGLLESKLDARVEEWTEQRRDACEGTHVRGEQSHEALDLRMRCLDRRAVEVESLLETYDTIEPEGVPLALTRLGRLPAIDVCADLEFLELSQPTPEAAEEREAVAKLRERGGRLNATSGGDNLEEFEAAAVALVADAVELGYEPFIAEAKLTRAKIESLLGHGEVAGNLYEEAFEHALATGHLKVQVWSAVVATFVYAEQVRDPKAADRWGRQAQALLRAHPYFQPARRALQTNLGSAALRAGDFDKAREHFDEAVRLFEEAGLGESIDAIGAEANLGILERRAGNLDEAMTRLEQAKANARRGLGDAHPIVGSISNSLAAVYLNLERFDDAEAQYRESLELLERNPATGSSRIGHPLNNLGQLLVERGEAEEGVPLLSRCIRLWTQSEGADYPGLAGPLSYRGEGLVALGRVEEAQADLLRARELQPKSASPDEQGRVLLLLARAYATTDQARAEGFIEDARALETTGPELLRKLADWPDAATQTQTQTQTLARD